MWISAKTGICQFVHIIQYNIIILQAQLILEAESWDKK